MEDGKISGVLYTKHEERSFFGADVFQNEEGNICIWFDEKSFVVLTTVMAKRLRKTLDEAIRTSLASVLGED